MKHYLIISLLLICSFSTLTAQKTFEQRYSSIEKELTTWDNVRGYWLATSLYNLSNKQPVNDRAFPEDFTPYELAKLVPNDLRNRIVDTIRNNANSHPEEANRWNVMNSIIGRVGCSYILGRSYGDPHLSSFDRANYSFQTVGEFVLVKSTKSNLEIQCRQKPQSDNFSLNTAVAMNVAGDRVAIYAEDNPNFNSSPIRVNGNAIQLTGRTYYLPHGGTIRLTGRNYIISYPSGEIANVEMRGNGTSQFLNVSVQVFDCDRNNFTGLLGNANNNPDDDFNGNNNRSNHLVYSNVFGNSAISQHAEKEYLAFLAGTFAEEWRVNQTTSLFDYGMGQSTLTFTDRSFPRVHFTVDDLTSDQRENARRNCEERGVLAADMRGCIFDQGFLNITPNPIPSNPDFTSGVDVKPILRPALNNNQHEFSEGKTPAGNALPIRPDNSNNSGKNDKESIDREIPKEIDKNPRENSTNKPIITREPKVSAPKPNVSNPAPRNPTAPKPSSSPNIRGIKGKN
jgi:hypothetical protein